MWRNNHLSWYWETSPNQFAHVVPATRKLCSSSLVGIRQAFEPHKPKRIHIVFIANSIVWRVNFSLCRATGR